MQLIHYHRDGEHGQRLWPHLLARPEGIYVTTPDRLTGNKPARSKTSQKANLNAVQLGALKLIIDVVWSKFGMDT